jgi:hypothetical protein
MGIPKTKLGRSAALVAIALIVLHGCQWYRALTGWLVAETCTEGAVVLRVRAVPRSGCNYLLLSTVSCSFRPALVECEYRCEVWQRGRLATSAAFYWDSLYSPQVTLRRLHRGADADFEAVFSITDHHISCSCRRPERVEWRHGRDVLE